LCVTSSTTAARRPVRLGSVLLLAAALTLLMPRAPVAQGGEGFQDTTLPQEGLTQPTVIQFAADGRVFVAQKSGRIFVYDDLNDQFPDTVADLRQSVYNFWDRGLLGMALDPNFPASPYLYVLYSYDAFPGGGAPEWGGGSSSDPCPNPPGANDEGCVVTGRLSRLDIGNPGIWPLGPGDETPLVTDWFQQFPSHSVGSLAFGPDGALYASGGDGANFDYVDYGQTASSPSAGDPAEQGGALRSQDLGTPGDPVTLDGTIIRIDPATGEALPNNPGYGASDDNEKRIVAYGLRNPFRITMRPGTSEIWAGDVGWTTWEEINRIVDPIDGTIENFGWPCYEGDGPQPAYEAATYVNSIPFLTPCANLYAAGSGAVVGPYYTYDHNELVVPGEACSFGSSSVSGMAFYQTIGGSYPAAYNGALFFADYSRKCIWAMTTGGGSLPNPGNRVTVAAGAAGPVNLVVGPGGDIFYPGFDDGKLHRLEYFGANLPPIAVIQANPTSGTTPLVVQFDGTSSSDPEGLTLTYAWDLDADGDFDDGSSATAQWTYIGTGTVNARLRVTDPSGLFAVATVPISVNNSAPVAIIDGPLGTLTWRVGNTINFAGRGTDVDEPSGLLPASGLSWELVMHHCPSNCHAHPIQTFDGVSSGSFVAPDHEYPSYLELKLTATDSEAVESTASVLLQPQTVALTFQTAPPGLNIAINAAALPAPVTRTVIIGSVNSVGAPSPQKPGILQHQFQGWSDGGTQNHLITAPATPTTYTATFTPLPLPAEVCGDGVDNDGDGSIDENCGPSPISTVPGPPGRLTGRVQGATVELSWLAPITGGAPSGYLLEAGLTPGSAMFQAPVGLITSVSVPGVGSGRYYARVRAANGVGVSAVSNEVIVTVGCTARPSPPVLTSAANGALVSLAWADQDGCTGTTYRLGVGSQPGTANLAQFVVPDSVFIAPAPPGTYYVRVVAETALGTSDPSNEVTLVVGAGCTPAPIPTILEATRSGPQVTLQWNPTQPATATAFDALWPLAYVLEIGTTAGGSQLGSVPVGRTTALTTLAPPGVYFARVRPVDSCGAGPVSNDVVVTVP
jgi:glucose/arabinose dehydrogenase